MSKKIFVIYHGGGCNDGFGAAWALWRKFGDEAQYIACQYGDPPPDVRGAEVYVVDFSFPRDVLLRMASDAEMVLVLDHHKTAEEDLRGLSGPNLFVQFDMSRSGARLAWDRFHGGAENWLIDYIQDRDLWRWKLPDSEVVNAYLGALKHEFHVFDAVFRDGLAAAVAGGVSCMAWIRKHVEATKKLACTADLLGYVVPVVNCTGTAISEIVGELSEGHSFAAGWFQRADGRFVYSLRSRGDFDVSELAKSMGGGGHKNAAGFTSDVLLHGRLGGA